MHMVIINITYKQNETHKSWQYADDYYKHNL